MRIALGKFSQETNTLAPQPATLQSFRDTMLVAGGEIVERLRGTATEIGGMLDAAAALGVEVAPTVAAKAVSSGKVMREAFEGISADLLAQISAARESGGLDAVVLALHGAMLVEGIDDGTGEVLRRVRALIGPKTPLVGTLDLHANLTRQMAEEADALVVYQTYPHVDLHRAGDRAMRLAVAFARGETRPTVALRRLPMILSPVNSSTSEGPAAEMRERLEEIERDPRVLTASFCATQPWLNVADMACAVVVATNDDQPLADRLADDLAARFWSLRARFYDFELTPIDEAIRRALASPVGPVVFADAADGTGSGSSGDSTAILEGLLRWNTISPLPRRGRGVGGVRSLAYLSIVDPEAVAACCAAGVGAEVALALGGKIDRVHYRPVEVIGRVRTLSDGTFTFKGPQSTGEEHRRGRTAVLAVEAAAFDVRIVLTETTCFNWDPEFYRSLGLEPRDARIVVVKSPTAFRAAYAGLMTDAISVDAPGPSTGNIKGLVAEMDRVRRPIYPFDDLPD